MINTPRLRCMIGWLGIALPWIVIPLVGQVPTSISATWYSAQAVTPFMIILGAAAFLLISYKGYNWIDDLVNTVAGLAALVICLCPCGGSEFWDLPHEAVGTFELDIHTSGMIHNGAAFVFFALLAVNSLFLFTKTDGNMTREKKIRNIIYRVCGGGMCAAFLLLIPIFQFPCKIWVVEAIGLFFFGLSYITKSNYYPWLAADKAN